MKSISPQPPFKKIKCVATIGVFDGVHLGHQLILKDLAREAKRLKVASVVVTFNIPPKQKLSPNFFGCLTDLKDRLALFTSLKIDYYWVLPSTSKIFNLSGEKFLKYLLQKMMLDFHLKLNIFAIIHHF